MGAVSADRGGAQKVHCVGTQPRDDSVLSPLLPANTYPCEPFQSYAPQKRPDVTLDSPRHNVVMPLPESMPMDPTLLIKVAPLSPPARRLTSPDLCARSRDQEECCVLRYSSARRRIRWIQEGRLLNVKVKNHDEAKHNRLKINCERSHLRRIVSVITGKRRNAAGQEQ